MTIEAANLPVIHIALHEVISLHPVLVRCEIGILEEICCAGLRLFELPIVCEAVASSEADRPVEVFPFNRTLQRTPLTVALDADIVRAYEIEFARVDDVGFGGMRDVRASGSVALFATNVPLGHLLRTHVIVHGMAAVAGGSSGAIKVCRSVERNPPVCTSLDVIREPLLFRHIPLCGQRKVVITTFREITLLESAAVCKCDIVECERAGLVWMNEVADYRLGVLFRIEHDIRHPALLPAAVLAEMATLAGL